MTENTIVLDADVKPLRLQLREATDELQMTRAKFGEMSTEAVKAAQKVAGIKDSINAANESAQLFDPGSRFQALTTAASTAAGGIAAVQGAMGLFGSESEEVEKALLKVQSAMALSQGLSQLKDIGKVSEQLKISFKGLTTGMSNFKKALIATGVGVLVTGLGLLVANFDAVKETLMKLFPDLSKVTDFFGKLIDKITDFVGITNEGDRELEKLTKTTEKNNKETARKIALLTAQGGKEKEIFDLQKKQNAEELALLTKTKEVKGKLSDEELEKEADNKNNRTILETNFTKKLKDEEEKRSADAQKESEKRQAEQEKMAAKTLAAQTILDEAKNQLLSEQKQEELAAEQSFQAKMKTLKEAGIVDDGTLENQRNIALKVIDDKFKAEEAQKEADFQKQVNDIRTQVRLEGIADENEKARESLLVDQENRRQAILMDEKTTQDQKRILLLELAVQEDQELKALHLTIAEQKMIEDLAELDAEAEKITTTFERRREIVAEQERINLELAGKTENERTAIVEAAAAERKAIDLAELSNKADLQNRYLDLAIQFGGVLKQLAGENKKVAIAGVIVEQSAAIGKIISNTAVANAKSVAALPLTGGLPFTAINTISAGLSIASTIQGAVKAIQGINNPKGVGGGSISAPSGISASAPQVASDVPTLGTSPVTALGTMMQNQPPLKAFVVESEVTGTQRRVADIERRAGF